ncbi:hypothetical protein VTK56DRAFT_10038 [Thermocarpiscus australiensis]
MSSPTPALPRRSTTTTSAHNHASLSDRLASVLPHGHRFGIHHVSTPPTRSEPLCAAPPGERPDKTYRESHFLAISINVPYPDSTAPPLKRASAGADQAKEPDTRKQVLVFAVEVFIFTTAYQTTLFVSKADSTGYLHLLKLPKGSASPIRQVCATFLAYLLDHRRRKHVQSVVNLFARAQAQYLFPGSVRNVGKHVLDDWGLVRWWCKALNPLMEGLSKAPWERIKGYLIVPGLEEKEARVFIPRTAASAQNWVIGHPLERISHYTREFDWVPPRCLIPGYPDDPKSRFRDELDEEVSKRKQAVGSWKSVRTLSQFWEMMAFRQECSSGRLTGFIWLVFDPHTHESSSNATATSSSRIPLLTPSASFDARSPSLPPATRPRRRLDISSNTPRSNPLKPVPSHTEPTPRHSKASKKKAKKKLAGRIVPRAPKIKTHARNYLLDRPTTTAYYYWPHEGRGNKIVDESEYKRIVELLLHLDFSTLDKAVSSSRRWVREVGLGEGSGGEVVGTAAVPDALGVNGSASGAAGGNVTDLTAQARRKNASQPSEVDPSQPSGAATLQVSDRTAAELTLTKQVNVLGANLVRKKKKDVESVDRPTSGGSQVSR